jgi:hypothetical protein
VGATWEENILPTLGPIPHWSVCPGQEVHAGYLFICASVPNRLEQNCGVRSGLLDTVIDLRRSEADCLHGSVLFALIAHGAGLVTCLTLLKDYDANPRLKGIGWFITLFVTGFGWGMFA